MLFKILHGTQQTLRFDFLGSHQYDLSHFNLRSFRHCNVQSRSIFKRGITGLDNVNCSIPIPLVMVVLPESFPRSCNNILIDHATRKQFYFALECLLLRTAHTRECVTRKSRQFLHLNDQKDFASPDFRKLNRDIIKKLLNPEVSNRFRDFLSWQRNFLANLKRTKQLDGLCICIVCTNDCQTSNGVLTAPFNTRTVLRMQLGR